MRNVMLAALLTVALTALPPSRVGAEAWTSRYVPGQGFIAGPGYSAHPYSPMYTYPPGYTTSFYRPAYNGYYTAPTGYYAPAYQRYYAAPTSGYSYTPGYTSLGVYGYP